MQEQIIISVGNLIYLVGIIYQSSVILSEPVIMIKGDLLFKWVNRKM